MSRVEETPAEFENTPATMMGKELNRVNVGNPHLDAINQCELDTVCNLKQLSGFVGVEEEETDRGEKYIVDLMMGGCTKDYKMGWLGLDPMTHKFLIAKNAKDAPKTGPLKANIGLTSAKSDDSCGSFHFPPGFGPCTDWIHLHYDQIRVPNLPQIKNPLSRKVVSAVEQLCACPSSQSNDDTTCHSETHSDEVIKQIKGAECGVVAVSMGGKDGEIDGVVVVGGDGRRGSTGLVDDGFGCDGSSGSSDFLSEDNLYRLNSEAWVEE
ncbi:hypothetical protein PIB30_080338 [Stylosanthes scabra]|uniref:Uncharacterized protein n=1 Tax=Stylosanthes scabra TaxID=79078 RepID=A0ABU6RRL0_9FABA|nr:hypothetical protein [Stylosanthes scabra]